MSPSTKNYIGVSLIGLAVFSFMAFILPEYGKIGQYKEAIKAREEVVKERELLMAKVASLQQEFEKRKSEVQKIGSIIPAKKSPAEIVSTVENVAATSGLQLTSLTMGEIVDEENTAYGTLNIEATVSGQYPSLTNFLAQLEQNLRLMNVGAIDAGLTQTPTGQTILSFKVTINAYFLK